MFSLKNIKGADRSWIMAAFGMVFVISGLAAAYFSAGQLVVGYSNSKHWVSVPATILRVELVSHRGSETTTYSINGFYRYQYNGDSFTSTDISLSKGSDNISNYWQELYSELKDKQTNNTATAWINPTKPSQAVLDRTFRWESMIFGAIFLLLFTGIGGVVTWFSLRQSPSREQQLILDKKSGISSNEKRSGLFFVGFGAVFFIFGSLMTALILPDALAEGNYAVLLILVFVLIGVGVIRHGIKQRSQYKRIGPTPLFLDPSPPCVAGEFGAHFTITSSSLTQYAFETVYAEATLQCLRLIKSGKSTRTQSLYEKTVPAFLTQTAVGIKGICKVDIPAECEPTKEFDSNSRTYWQLVVKGDFSSQELGQFKRTWEVHVDAENELIKSKLHIPEAFIMSANERMGNIALSQALQQVLVSEDTQFLELVSPIGKNWFGEFAGMLIGAGFAGMGYFFVTQGQWLGTIFLVIGCLILFGCVISFGGAINCKIDKHSLLFYWRRSWFGITYSKKECAIFNPEQLSIKTRSSVQSGGEMVKLYNLYLEYNGKKYKVAKSLKGERAANAMKAKISNALFK